MENIIREFLVKNNLHSLISIKEIEVLPGKKIDKNNSFILLQGYVDIIYKENRNKDVLHRVHPLDFQLCNVLPVLGLDPHMVNFNFSDDSLIGLIDHEKLKKLSEKPDFLKKLYLNSARFIYEKLKHEEFMRRLSGEEKLAYHLLKYSKDNKYKVDNYSDFAKVLRSDRNYIYKIIWKLERKNLIEKKKNILLIKDKKGLLESYSN